jgi:hypothetical protein
MGYGEFVGNESVHWTMTHEDEEGTPVAMSSRQGHDFHPNTGHDVHVEKMARGCDPCRLDDVGRRKGHKGRYRVRLRFKRLEDAKAALAAARDVMSEDGVYVIVLDVPVIRRKHADDPPPAEVRVDW